MTKDIAVVQLPVHCLSGVTSPAVLGLNEKVGGPNVSLTPPDRHAKDLRREHTIERTLRSHWLTVGE